MPFKRGDKNINRNGRPKGKTNETEIREGLMSLEPKAFNALEKGLEKGYSWAVRLFYEYSLTKPKTEIDATINDKALYHAQNLNNLIETLKDE